MLDAKLLRNSLDTVAAQLKQRGFTLDVDKFQVMEDKRKSLQVEMQTLQNERNVKSKAVGFAKSKGESADAALAELKIVSEKLKSLEHDFEQLQLALHNEMAQMPNIYHASVPIGKTEDENIFMREWGVIKTFDFTPKDHVELCVQQGWLDTETAAKLSGARFVVLRGPIARLHRALAQFMLDMHIDKHGYTEINVPYIVNADTLFGTTQLPKFKDDLFAIAGDDQKYLISTAEIPVTNTVRDEIIPADQLPIKYACYSACFRSEAGTYGKDMRGMFRQHQFEKVELVQIVKPDDSYAALEEMTQHAEAVLQALELPYRCVEHCTGDLGFAAAKSYDLEVWLPGQQNYREISSISNTENFQARRMQARYRDENGKIDLVHTLNGSALAIGRTLIAVIENNQDALGRMHVPTVLQPYMGGIKIITTE